MMGTSIYFGQRKKEAREQAVRVEGREQGEKWISRKAVLPTNVTWLKRRVLLRGSFLVAFKGGSSLSLGVEGVGQVRKYR